MTEFIQKFLLNNTKGLQRLVNQKLANGSVLPNFFRWMEIGPRGYGKHILPKWIKAVNSFFLIYGFRWNHARPHMTKILFSREREVLVTGYAGLFILLAFWSRKNVLRPIDHARDSYLYHYDNPNHLYDVFGKKIPVHYTSYKVSAHYLEINKIFSREMMRKFGIFEQEVAQEYNSSSEKVKRTKYLSNPNYVYEAYGWENNSS